MAKGGENVPSINDLLNKISDFKCAVDGKEIVFPGILQEKNGNVILNAKFPLEQYRKIDIEADIVIIGEVSGRKATLLGCHISSVSCTIGHHTRLCALAGDTVPAADPRFRLAVFPPAVRTNTGGNMCGENSSFNCHHLTNML